jgi:hypothetical protein
MLQQPNRKPKSTLLTTTSEPNPSSMGKEKSSTTSSTTSITTGTTGHKYGNNNSYPLMTKSQEDGKVTGTTLTDNNNNTIPPLDLSSSEEHEGDDSDTSTSSANNTEEDPSIVKATTSVTKRHGGLNLFIENKHIEKLRMIPGMKSCRLKNTGSSRGCTLFMKGTQEAIDQAVVMKSSLIQSSQEERTLIRLQHLSRKTHSYDLDSRGNMLTPDMVHPTRNLVPRINVSNGKNSNPHFRKKFWKREEKYGERAQYERYKVECSNIDDTW